MNIKKSILFLFIVLSLIIGLYFVSRYLQSKRFQKNDAVLRIAILQPATHAALDEIAQGFIDTMQKNPLNMYLFDRYNANGSKILMQGQVQDIIEKNYDLIFTIAVTPSIMMHNACQKQKKITPIVFTAVDDPEKLDLQGINLTGVIDQSNYPEQLNLLFKIKPSIKKMLLVYDQSQASGLEKDKNEIQSIIKGFGAQLVCAEILTISDMQQKVKGLIDSVDVVMVLKDSTVVSGIDSLISLCQRYHVTLLASDLNSGARRAALAYGIYEAESGIQAAYQAKLILEHRKLPSQVPVVSVKNMKMKINCTHAKLQGLEIDSKTFSMFGVELDQKGDDHV